MIATLLASGDGGAMVGQPVATFTDSGVQVRLTWASDAGVQPSTVTATGESPAHVSPAGASLVSASRADASLRGMLTVTFTPLQPGFHLYSMGLPAEGIDGVGRPTRVEVGGALRSMGLPATAEPVRLESIAGLAQPMPVYAAGAVTLWVPVAIGTGASGARAADAMTVEQVWISYAACSGQLCLAPVTRHLVKVRLSGSGSP